MRSEITFPTIRFYPQLLEVVAERGTLVDRFGAPVYGIRLVRYLDVDNRGTTAGNGPGVEIYRLDG
jgi:hypothetical protein